jgi:fumarate hydratase, class II
VKIANAVAEETNLPFVTAENKFEALVSVCIFDTKGHISSNFQSEF